jgi:hypothetical protein
MNIFEGKKKAIISCCQRGKRKERREERKKRKEEREEKKKKGRKRKGKEGKGEYEDSVGGFVGRFFVKV